MAEHELRKFDYVNHPYRTVRDVLCADPQGVFRAATKAAASRAESVAAQLNVGAAGLHIAAEIAVSIGEIEERDGHTSATTSIRIPIEWEAAHQPRLFPLMSAVLSVYPLTATETQLDFLGYYDPPFGVLGRAVDAVVGHRIAEASVHRFVTDIADFLRTNLA